MCFSTYMYYKHLVQFFVQIKIYIPFRVSTNLKLIFNWIIVSYGLLKQNILISFFLCFTTSILFENYFVECRKIISILDLVQKMTHIRLVPRLQNRKSHIKRKFQRNSTYLVYNSSLIKIIIFINQIYKTIKVILNVLIQYKILVSYK